MSWSRRDFLATSAATAFASALGRPSLLTAWQQAPAPVFTDLRRRVGHFNMSGGTIGFLNDPRGCVVVDSGINVQVAGAFLEGLKKRSDGAAIHRLINTHYHGDHVGGNLAFKGQARKVVAHEKTLALHKAPPQGKAAAGEQLYADTTFADTLREQAGTEWVRCKYYGGAHTAGDIVITFEQANVAHMGDLVFNKRMPVVDPQGGTSLKNWITVLEKATADHAADTIYIFGHAGQGAPVSGARADVMVQRDFITALLAHVTAEVKAGKTRADVTGVKMPLKGFEGHGPLSSSALSQAFDEVRER
jgi:cyclase